MGPTNFPANKIRIPVVVVKTIIYQFLRRKHTKIRKITFILTKLLFIVA